MDVILREHVDKLGKRGDVIRVADGFARNFLIPNKLAYKLTEGVRRQVESEARATIAREERDAVAAQGVVEQINALQVVRFQRKAGAHGVLFGSVTNVDIAEALQAAGISVERRQIRLDDAIKRVGTHHVTVHLFREISAELAVEVEAEGGEADTA